MLRDRTAFIVGAGASADFGFPLGGGLVERIASKLRQSLHQSSSYDATTVVFEKYFNRQSLPAGIHDAARKVAFGVIGTDSIDDFIEAHENDASVNEVAKFAIAEAILVHESRDGTSERRLYLNNQPNEKAIQSSAYMRLWRLLQRGLRKSDVESIFSHANFVVFNYDRTLEEFFALGLVDEVDSQIA